MLKLIIEDDEGKTTVVPLIRDEITIGRKEGNTIRLTERNVSRRHARILRQNGGIFIEDLNSYNGIKLNGARIEGQATVGEGDRIQIGDYVLALKQDQPAATAPVDPFDEMKTIPVEKAEAKAMAAHLAQSVAPAAPAAPAPATQEPAPQQPRHQDLIEAAAESAARPPAAKLVVVSSNFAGMECPLDKAAQVIGRTLDNDIVVEHRSVSKHHAKVVRDGNTFTIIDQGSANGVYVNGEKYERTDLRSGDMVDLGHVRLRFVAPGEDFVFDPSMTVDTSTAAGPAKGAPIGLIVGGIVGIAILVAILFATGVIGGKKKTSSSKADTAPSASAQVDGGPPKATQAAHRAIRAALGQQDWKTAIREADSLLLKDPTDDLAKQLRQQAVDEQKNQEHFDKFQENLRVGKLAPAVFHGSQVAKDSVYYPKVSTQLAAVKTRLRKQVLADAQRLSKAGDCDGLRGLRKSVELVSPGDPTYLSLVRSCVSRGSVAMNPPETPPVLDSSPAAHKPRRRARHRPRRRVTPPARTSRRRPGQRPPSTGPREAGGKSAAQLLAEARSALMANQYGKAIRLARASIRKKWTSNAWGVLGVAACKAGRRSTAKQAYRALHGGYRSMLVSVCRQSGITLE